VAFTPEQVRILELAHRQGLLEGQAAPAFRPPWQCTLLTFALALPTLGFSLVLVPLLWVAQYEHTNARLRRLEQRLMEGSALERLEVVLHL